MVQPLPFTRVALVTISKIMRSQAAIKAAKATSGSCVRKQVHPLGQKCEPFCLCLGDQIAKLHIRSISTFVCAFPAFRNSLQGALILLR